MGNVKKYNKLLLVDTQLSNYTKEGVYILEADSGWQMVINRIRVMLQMYSDLEVHVTVPTRVRTPPHQVNPDLFAKYGGRLQCIPIELTHNALANRYDFSWHEMQEVLPRVSEYTHVYVNDPMRLRALKAFFHLVGKNKPRFVVHSHFVDVPSCPKFPIEASLWLGQCEAAIRADYNFWQCETALKQFKEEFAKLYRDDVVESVMAKSQAWDDGFSVDEICELPNEENIRFDLKILVELRNSGKTVVFVPNRVGGGGKSSDYTNCGKFLSEVPKLLHKHAPGKFAFIAGNPSAKWSNEELYQMYGQYGFVKLTDDPFNRDEYKTIARRADIAVGLYDQDCYGGTAARECVELGCLPIWLNVYEYKKLSQLSHNKYATVDSLEAHEIAKKLIKMSKFHPQERHNLSIDIRDVVREHCSYESTSEKALKYLFGEVEDA